MSRDSLNLEAYGTCTLEQDGCTTCGDIAIPVRVIQIEANNAGLNNVVVEDRLGQQTEVATDFVDNVQLDDVLLVHMGIALSKITPSNIDVTKNQQLEPAFTGGN
ncbi:MAG: HypC/HybG/HupF family hydrogenase formation chaperone [Deinococcota bacterium]